MTDPLAPFRKGAPKTPTATSNVEHPPKDEYVAFGAKDRVMRLRIRCAAAPTHAPVYSSMLNLIYDGPHGTSVVLHFDFLMVLIRGQNLQAMIGALENSMAEYIQEFDAGRWPRPADKSAAIIDSIEIVAKQSPNSASDSGKSHQQTGH